jgi:hypothetical protein
MFLLVLCNSLSATPQCAPLTLAALPQPRDEWLGLLRGAHVKPHRSAAHKGQTIRSTMQQVMMR